MLKSKKVFYFSAYGYSKKNFKQWGKLGGRPKQYVSNAEKQKAYRRRQTQQQLLTGQRIGILNMTTGRINRLKPKKQVKGKEKKINKID